MYTAPPVARTLSRSPVSSSLRTLRVQNACVHMAQVPFSLVSCAKHSHPHMFHPPSLLFPHGHFDVRFPSSPAPPPAVTFPRSVSTPSSPRRATLPGGSVSGSLANLTTNTGYEPKYNVDDDTEITPIIYPDTDDRKLDHVSV